MSHRHANKRHKPIAAPRAGMPRWLYGVLAVVVITVVILGLLFSRGDRPIPVQAGPLASTPGQAVPPSQPVPDFQTLVGKWLRQDGDYVIDIRSVTGDGKMEAAYINPERPIHVSRSEALRSNDRMRVFLKLDDDGYPGCTYNLTYDPQQDVLVGIYYQAQMQESYEVGFVRMTD